MPPHTPIIKGLDQAGATTDDVYLHGPRGGGGSALPAAASGAASDDGPVGMTPPPGSALHGDGWIV